MIAPALPVVGFVMSLFSLQATAPAVGGVPEKLDLVLLVGQSNMAGRGKVEAQDQAANPHVWTLGKDDRWRPATDPIHFDKPAVVGVGLGRSFAQAVLAAGGSSNIGLIPSAFGGTSIDQWNKGGELYENAVRRAKAAAPKGRLIAILWHQGESDSSESKLPAYPAKLEALVANFRADLGAPNVPFVIGHLGPFRTAKAPATPAFNDMLTKFAQSHPNVACVTAENTTSIGDDTHFDSASLRELGRRYAAAYLKLAGKPTTRPSH